MTFSNFRVGALSEPDGCLDQWSSVWLCGEANSAWTGRSGFRHGFAVAVEDRWRAAVVEVFRAVVDNDGFIWRAASMEK